MTLAQLQVFIAVAEAKNFTKAAESLGFTQSAVSQMIQSLEKELGVPLFHRSRKGVATTNIGERMLQHAREMLRISSRMQQEAKAAQGIETGTLRIGSIHSVSNKILPGLIGSFRKLFPQVDIVLFEGEYEEVNSWISSSVVDVGFTTVPGKDMESYTLATDRMVVVVPDDHPLRSEPYLTFSHIRDKCFIMPKDECIKKLLHTNGLASTVAFEVRDVTTILAMVQEWVGVTIVPELYLPEMLPKVVPVPLSPTITRELVISTRSFDSVSPIAAEFIVHSQHYIKQRAVAI
ncbi:LysR family transcriptional regulator [Brevibacillus borstelensis]|uniref:LysR family transcriptional regulator n=1 Tax=Brevibacillus borstelensis TaxID=45462 RepID=UPI00149084E2|nr:LysR family transcriptional regulator [Brevibacillus borstelensis]MBE5397329.1 LysR family transcriptional regulator [Brevibacillus borstelensis]MCC0567134.1 LysR family transcriptional regulator [Brevibacillus borstelensis]MED1854678.1 LysR family transcriptional regulator [Brevibacillus borstelensis]NOU56536.1 LysR family transcriptional regulator [Brevibacillus borstelensis]